MGFVLELYHYYSNGLLGACVCGAYGKTLCRSAVSHTPASQIELALTAPSASRMYLCVHWGH